MVGRRHVFWEGFLEGANTVLGVVYKAYINYSGWWFQFFFHPEPWGNDPI